MVVDYFLNFSYEVFPSKLIGNRWISSGILERVYRCICSILFLVWSNLNEIRLCVTLSPRRAYTNSATTYLFKWQSCHPSKWRWAEELKWKDRIQQTFNWGVITVCSNYNVGKLENRATDQYVGTNNGRTHHTQTHLPVPRPICGYLPTYRSEMNLF